MVELVGIQLEQPARGRDWLQRAELLIERHEAGRGHRVDLLSSRALLQLVAGEHEESVRTQDEVLLLLEPEDEWPIRAAGMHQHAAMALEALGRDGEAAKRYARALELLASAFGEEHPRLGQVLHNLGVLEYGRGRFETTLEHLDRAVALKQAAYGPEHPSVARSLEGRGLALIGLGRFDEALQSLERAAEILERTLGHQHPELGVSLVNVGTAASRARDFERAAEAFDRGIAILRDTLGGQDSALATALGDRSAFRLAQANPALARVDVEAALAIAQDGGDPRTHGWTLARYANLLAAEGKREDAAATATKALATLAPFVGDDHPDLEELRILAGTG